MGTSTRFKPYEKCLKCNKNTATMSWQEQQDHIAYHKRKDEDDKKQQKLF